MKIAITTLTVIAGLVLAGVASACYEYNTVQICYGGETISVPSYLVQGYLGNEATLGPCEELPVVVVDSGPAHTYLCGSWLFKGTTPSVQLLSDAPALTKSGQYRIPIAITVTEADKQGIPAWARNPVGNDVLACDRDGLKATGTGYNGAGGTSDFFGVAQWKALITGTPSPYNHYEKWS